MPVIIYFGEKGFKPFNWSEIIIYIMLSILILESLMLYKKRKIKSKLFFPVFLFIGWIMTMSLLNSITLMAGIASFITHVKYVPLLFILPVFIKKTKDIENIVLIILLIGFFTAILGLYLIAKGIGYEGLFGLAGVRRAVSLFPNSNMLGVYLSSIAPLGMVYWLRRDINLKNVSYTLIFLAPIIAMIILTYSRRAWITLAIGLLILFWKVKTQKIRFVFLIIIGLLTSALIFTLDLKVILLRISTIFDLDYPSQAKRIEAFSSIFEIVTSNILFLFTGLGSGSYGPSSVFTGELKLIDSYFMLLLVEYGIIGIFFYVWILIALLQEVFDIERNCEINERILLYGILIGVIVIIFSGLFGTNPITSPTNMYLWVFIGFIISIKNIILGDKNYARTKIN